MEESYPQSSKFLSFESFCISELFSVLFFPEQKAILEAGPEWADNKKLHSLKEKDVQHVVSLYILLSFCKR